MVLFTTHKEGTKPQRPYKYVRLLLSPTEAGEKHSPGSLYFLPIKNTDRDGNSPRYMLSILYKKAKSNRPRIRR